MCHIFDSLRPPALFALFLFTFFSEALFARQTNISGTVTGALIRANSPYVVTGDISVPENNSLSIEPGVVVKFNSGRNLFVSGSLDASGSAQNPIYFTSIFDDGPAGDTNGDGNATTPAPGQWGRIEINESSGSSVRLENCVIRYGGNFYAMIRVLDASPTIRNCAIEGSRFVAGLSMDTGGSPIIENNSFSGNVTAAMSMQSNVFPVFSGNSASSNGVNGIIVPGGVITKSGLWTAVDLPYIITADLVVGDTDANTPPIALTLRPGAVVKLSGRSMFVRDAFIAQGKPDSLIVFTSLPDDAHGGDTNNDGNGTQPAVGQWGRIEIAASSADLSLLEHCLVRFGGNFYAMIRVLDASPTIRNCAIEGSRFVAGLSMDTGGSPIIENNSFSGNVTAAMSMQSNVFPVFSGNSASSNGVNGIVVPGGVITKSGLWTAVDLPYIITADLVVGDTDANTPPIALTLRPGAVVKLSGRSMFVRDAFIAQGKPDSLIVFTSFFDDSHAGDTNNDGGLSQPEPGQWGRIEIAASSADLSLLEHCAVRYGGNFYAMIRVLDASPTIRNCAIDSSRFVAGLSMATGGNPIIENNSFSGNVAAAMSMQANVFPHFSGNSASGNSVNGIVVPGGVITKSGLWTAVDLPYIITADLSVGDTDQNTAPIALALRSGAVVKLDGRSIFVRDAFIAQGKPDSLIVFTSLTDDAHGGDTNNDGNGTQPAVGQWGRIEIAESSADLSLLEHCLVRYGGNFYAMIRVLNASPTIRNCSIDRSRFVAGLSMATGGNPIVENNSFSGNVAAAMSMQANIFPTYSGNRAFNNGVNGIVVPGGTLTKSGLWTAVDLPYIITADLGVGDTDTNTPPIALALSPGVIVKLSGRSIFVRDSLRAAGKADSLIVFTSFLDDLYGGDSNNDGNATQAAAGQWGRIEFTQSSDSSGLLQNCILRYGGNFTAMLRLAGASPAISHSKIEFSRFTAGLSIESGSSAIITRNVIANNNVDGIFISASSPAITNNTIYGNGRDGIANTANTIAQIKNNIIASNNRYGLFCDAGSQPANSYNNSWGNAVADFQGCTPGAGDISDDPEFIDAANDIFELLSRSPSVNTGDPAEFDPGTTSRIDMGAFPFKGVPGVPIRIFALSGNNQSWYVENALLEPLVVQITDAFVDGIAGVKVNFSVLAGGGSLESETIETDASGKAQTEWTLGKEVGLQRVEVQAADFDGNLLAGSPLVFTAQADSIPPAPAIAFTEDTTTGFTPLRVQFTSQITGVHTGLEWDFGDGDTSTVANPLHAYETPGIYSVSLKAAGPGGENVLAKDNLIEARLRIFGSITGRVVDYNGKNPVENVVLKVTGTTTKDTMTNSHGQYFLEQIRVGTGYLLQPQNQGMFFQPPHIAFPVFNDDFAGQNFIASFYGDVSGNDKVQSFDASVLLRQLVGLVNFANAERDSIAADVSGNAALNAFDASLILRFVAGLIAKFPVEDSSGANLFLAARVNGDHKIHLSAQELVKDMPFITPVLFEPAEEIYSFDLEIAFDPEIVHLKNITAGEVFRGFQIAHTQAESTVRIAAAGTMPVAEKAVALLLEWQVQDGIDAIKESQPIAITQAATNEGDLPLQIIDADFLGAFPDEFWLWQNYPNPFNPETVIRYEIPALRSAHAEENDADSNSGMSGSVNIKLKIYNLIGQHIRTLVDDLQKPGSYHVTWDGADDLGRSVPAGIYIYRLQTEKFVQSKKMLLIH